MRRMHACDERCERALPVIINRDTRHVHIRFDVLLVLIVLSVLIAEVSRHL